MVYSRNEQKKLMDTFLKMLELQKQNYKKNEAQQHADIFV